MIDTLQYSARLLPPTLSVVGTPRVEPHIQVDVHTAGKDGDYEQAMSKGASLGGSGEVIG